MLYARLAQRDGRHVRRVLCGHRTCRGQLAVVTRWRVVTAGTLASEAGIGFASGWRQRPDGVWALTNPARQLIRRGYPPRHRRGFVLETVPAGGTVREVFAGTAGARQVWAHGLHRAVLPARAQCPVCGAVSLLTEELLAGLDPL
jgi:hypothetical protein